MRLKPGGLEGYRGHHDNVWRELVDEIERSGNRADHDLRERSGARPLLRDRRPGGVGPPLGERGAHPLGRDHERVHGRRRDGRPRLRRAPRGLPPPDGGGRNLDGKVAVVTGASRGLGKDVAVALAERGARVAAVSRRAERFRCDVSRPEDVERLRARIEAELGAPQILVNAAGIFGPVAPLTRADTADWVETIAVDLVGPYLTCRAFAGGTLELGWGRIVNVSSAASLLPPGPLGSAYATAKAGLNQLTRHLASELEGTGVTANVIHPGDVKTDMWGDIRDQVALLGPEGEGHREWVEWVDRTGGDPPWKAVDLVLRILDHDVNGAFLWIDEPLGPELGAARAAPAVAEMTGRRLRIDFRLTVLTFA